MSDRSLMLMAASFAALLAIGLVAGILWLRARTPDHAEPVGTVVAGIDDAAVTSAKGGADGKTGDGTSDGTDEGTSDGTDDTSHSGAMEPATVDLPSGSQDTITTTLDADDADSSRQGAGQDGAGRVGLIAGHWQYDTGAVCSDGRREVDVTKDVAMRARAILEVRGYEVDLLPDHDPAIPQPPLQNYLADAVVSIHADSCEYVGVSGYKVARWAYSEMPEVEDRLVECLYDEYGASTLMNRHDDTLTAGMWNYYAFRELAVDTPAAIIELGFLGADRKELEELRYEMAMGIANGIGCFLERAAD